MDNSFTLLEVNSKKAIRRFLDFPAILYKDDKNWIRPLDQDIEKIFDRDKNKQFRDGEAIRWILVNDNKEVVGRIAAFYNSKTAAKDDQPTGGMGFFDCINVRTAAHTLFDAARDWLKDKGMEIMDGPVNFGSRDNFWGCLVDGFYEPIYNMPYNHKYYNDLFESYGFQNYFNQYTFHLSFLVSNFDDVIFEKAAKLKRDPKYTFEYYNKKCHDKYVDDFLEIFNAAWAKFPGVQPMKLNQVKALFKGMKKIADPGLLLFSYHDDRPIAFFIMIPDLYQITRKFNGKFSFFHKLWFMYELKVRKVCTRAIGMIFGVVPDFQGKGVAPGMIDFFNTKVTNSSIKYTDLEMNWIGDFNPGMIRLVEQINGKIRKTHITYRYLFDRDKEFIRAKVV